MHDWNPYGPNKLSDRLKNGMVFAFERFEEEKWDATKDLCAAKCNRSTDLTISNLTIKTNGAGRSNTAQFLN